MSLYTVDVYSDSSDDIIRDSHAQGVIVKATQGNWYVNDRCNHQWELAGSLGKLRGLYHYAEGGNPETEAQFFINNIKNYVGQGPLFLDWEEGYNHSWGDTNWARRFVNEVHRLTGVWCGIYVQESALWQVANCAKDCFLWVAKYASMYWYSWTLPNMNVSSGAFQFITGWQFTGGDMDRSIFYIDADGWKRLASPNGQVQAEAHGFLDDFSIKDNKLHISGWYANNDAVGKNCSYVILTSEDIHTEYARAKSAQVARPDVAKAYPSLKDAGQSGFDVSLPLPKAAVGHKVRVIFRHTDDPAGNGHAADWSTVVDLGKSAAYLDRDDIEQYTNKLKVSGWFASDWSLVLQYHYLILYDQTAKKEVQRLKVQPTLREDVAKANPDIFNAAFAGFSGEFDYSQSLIDHDLQIVARYSNDGKNGEGTKADYWFKPFKGPNMPVLDGEHEMSIIVHSFSAESTSKGTLLKFK